jgi:hypothetical protein
LESIKSIELSVTLKLFIPLLTKESVRRSFRFSLHSLSQTALISIFAFSGIVGDVIDLRANEREPAEPSGGGGERLHDREEADRRGTLSHLVFLPEGRPFFFGPSTLIGSAAEIILTH